MTQASSTHSRSSHPTTPSVTSVCVYSASRHHRVLMLLQVCAAHTVPFRSAEAKKERPQSGFVNSPLPRPLAGLERIASGPNVCRCDYSQPKPSGLFLVTCRSAAWRFGECESE